MLQETNLTKFDVLVIGLGAAGSAALYHLSKTSCKVAGIDRYRPPHHFGSSHGESRIIRQAYYETPLYVPFVQKALKLWLELEQAYGKQLFIKNGSIMLGEPDSQVIKGALSSAVKYNIAHHYLSNSTIKDKYPAFKPSNSTVGVLEEDAGLLLPETCISAHIELAEKHGATLLMDERVISLRPVADGVAILTNKSHYLAAKVIVSAGAWTNELLPHLRLPLSVERRTVHWFKSRHSANTGFSPRELPVFIWEYDEQKMFYGFPDLGNGLKIASTKKGIETHPGYLDRNADIDEINEAEQLVRQYFNLDPVHAGSSVCMYTNTPDEHFIIDFHPEDKNIILASPCSGHGFKFASLTGKILADMALHKPLEINISPFRINRF